MLDRLSNLATFSLSVQMDFVKRLRVAVIDKLSELACDADQPAKRNHVPLVL